MWMIIDASQGGLFRSLGKGLGCVLIKSTLGPGKTQKGWRLEGEGYAGAMGDKRGQFTSNLGLRWTFPSQAGGRQVSRTGINKGKCYVQNICNLCRMNDE